MNTYKNAFRFYGFQKLLCLLVAAPVVGLLITLALESPPDSVTEWTPVVRRSVQGLAIGSWTIAGMYWTYTLLRPLIRSRAIRGMLVSGLAVFISGFGVLGIASGLLALLMASGYRGEIIASVFDLVLLPLGVGAAIVVWPDLKTHVKSHPTLRRWFISGTGHNSGWAGPLSIRKYVDELPTTQPERGHFSDKIFIGRTNFEDTFASGDELFLDGPSHLCTIAQTGGGKHICAAPNYSMYRGSMVHCTVKPEAADQFLGARVDQELLSGPSAKPTASQKGIDPRGLTKATRWIPRSRCYLLDVANQSVYPSSRHTLISEIDVNSSYARVLALAIADGSFPERPTSSDPWFREAPRNFFAASILHALTHRDRRWASLPRIVERAMGIDRLHGKSGPQVVQDLLLEMSRNHHPNVGNFIQTTAAQILELGDRGYGTLKSEFHTNCSWTLDPHMEQQLVGTSDFSYSWLGDDDNPVTVFNVPPRGDAALRAALPWLRAHAELSLQILQTKKRRPKTPTLFVADEARQYLQGISSIKTGLTLLRDASVRCWLMFQSWPSALEVLGKDAAVEMEACSTMQYFAINDIETATRISQRLGMTTIKQRSLATGKTETLITQVISPDEVLRELSLTSPVSYVMGGGVMPMRIRRVAYKPIRTNEGAHFDGLNLAGQFDEGLSRYSYGR